MLRLLLPLARAVRGPTPARLNGFQTGLVLLGLVLLLPLTGPTRLLAQGLGQNTVVARCQSYEVTAEELVGAMVAAANAERISPELFTEEDLLVLAETLLIEKLQYAELEQQGFERNPWLQPLLINYVLRNNLQAPSRPTPRPKVQAVPTSPAGSSPAAGAGAGEEGASVEEKEEPEEEKLAPTGGRQDGPNRRDGLARELRAKADVRLDQARIDAYLLRRQDLGAWDVRVIPDPLPAEDVLGTIDGVPLSSQELEVAIARIGGRWQKDGQLTAEGRSRALDLAINYRLLARDAIQRGALKDDGVTNSIRRRLQRRGILVGWVDPRVSQEDLEQYYQSHIEEFIIPEHVLVTPFYFGDQPEGAESARQKAEAFRTQLLGLPMEGRFDPALRRQGGRVMSAGRWMVSLHSRVPIDAADVRALLKLSRGEVGPVMRIHSGYVVPLINEHNPARLRTFEQSRASVLRSVVTRRRLLLPQLHYRDLMLSLGAELDEAAISGVYYAVSQTVQGTGGTP